MTEVGVKLRRRARMAAFAAMACVVSSAAPAASQSAAPSGPTRAGGHERFGGVADRLNVRGGFLFASHTTTARLDSRELGIGTTVDVEDALGLDTDSRDMRLDAYVRLGRRHQLRAGYVSLERTASVDLVERIQWGDEVFDVDVRVASTFDVLLLPVSYRFSLLKGARVDLGLSAGVFAMFADASVAAPDLGIAEGESADFPLPVLGADVDIAVAPRLFVVGGFEYFGITVSDVHGSWYEVRAALEYYPHRHFGLGAGYRRVDLEVDTTEAFVDGSIDTGILFDYRFAGPQVYLTLTL